jgi:hypothetical protein
LCSMGESARLVANEAANSESNSLATSLTPWWGRECHGGRARQARWRGHTGEVLVLSWDEGKHGKESWSPRPGARSSGGGGVGFGAGNLLYCITGACYLCTCLTKHATAAVRLWARLREANRSPNCEERRACAVAADDSQDAASQEPQ